VVVLTKADVADDAPAARRAVEQVAFDCDVAVCSAVTGQGVDELAAYARPNRTIALIGASGAGKSTLINQLIGEDRQETADVREADGKGRHTTTRRELIALPEGGVLVDTPGLRGLGLWDAEAGVSLAFGDIQELASECKFRDCRHEHEPDCAVKAAINRGDLAPRRLESWLRLRNELAHLTRLQQEQEQQAGEGRRPPTRRGQRSRRGSQRKKRRR